MKLIINTTLILLLFVSCKQENKHSKTLIISDSIKIPIEKYVLNSSSCLNYSDYKNEQSLYYITNNSISKSNEILIFNLKEKKLERKIEFSKENGFEKTAHGFTFINKDSLIVYNILSDTLLLINSKNIIIGKLPYSYKNTKTNQTLYKLFSRNLKPIIYNKGELIFSPSIHYDNKNDLLNKSILFSYNIKEKKVKNLNFVFPKEFVNTDFFSTEMAYCANKDKIIFSPTNSHEIWIANIKNNTFKKAKAESNYFRHFCKYDYKEVTMPEAMYNLTYNSSYQEIIYDKYRKVYYRFFYPGIDIEKEDESLAIKTNYFEKMSIIILDADFKKIGEVLFDNKFRFYSSFVTEDGLYLNSNMPYTKGYKENEIKYTILKLKNE